MYTNDWLALVQMWKTRAYLAGRTTLLHSLILAEAELQYTASFDSYR